MRAATSTRARPPAGSCLFIILALAAPRAVAGPAAGDVPLIPRAVLFAAPQRTNLRLSPDGTRICYLAPAGGARNLWVQTIGRDDARLFTRARQRKLTAAEWAENGEQILYLHDPGGDGNHHLYAVDLASGDIDDLTPYGRVRARLVGADRDRPDEILVSMVGMVGGASDHREVWRLDTRSGERMLAFDNRQGWTRLRADRQLNVRLGTRATGAGGRAVMTRDGPDEPWYELIRWPPDDAAASRFLGFSRDGRTLYLLDSRDADTARLRAYTRPAAEHGRPRYEMLAFDARVDPAEVIIDPTTGRPQAVAFDDARRRWRLLDDALRSDWEYLADVDEGDLTLVGRDRSDRRWLVGYRHDDRPIVYYLYDRNAPAARRILTARPALEGLPLAPMEPVVVHARDGLALTAYLTRPTGPAPSPGPMVLLVHGGPWDRDRWGYDPVHQWLANRGYAVLSVNYRGSAGFGKRFLRAGYGEWAGRMQEDLMDAVIWAVDAGVADADRVAIMGASYGGYAVLAGLTFTPTFFAAGVDLFGPAHVGTLLESMPAGTPARALFERRIGQVDEPDELDLISPLMRMDEIRRPLLIGQGGKDRRAPETETLQILQTLQGNGVPVACMVFPDEGHAFTHARNALAFFALTEAFLARHLGGRAEPPAEAVRASGAKIIAGEALLGESG